MQKFNKLMENMIIKSGRTYSTAICQLDERLSYNKNKDSMSHYSVELTVY